MANNKVVTTSGGGIGFAGLLTIVFITLKLCGVINWAWIWVLSPLIISVGLSAVLFLLVFTLLVITAVTRRI